MGYSETWRHSHPHDQHEAVGQWKPHLEYHDREPVKALEHDHWTGHPTKGHHPTDDPQHHLQYGARLVGRERDEVYELEEDLQ